MTNEEIIEILEQAARTGEMTRFPHNPIIAAHDIVRLAISCDPQWHHKGLYIDGATIHGVLDFEDATLPRPLFLFNCHVSDRPNFHRARCRSMGFIDSTLEQGLMLRHATIDGDLSLINSTVHADKEGNAIKGDGVQVNGGAYLRHITAHGQIRFVDGRFNQFLSFAEATLKVPADQIALKADGSIIAGGLFLNKDFSCTGGIELLSVNIAKDLSLNEATLKGRDSCLNLQGAVIGQTLILKLAEPPLGSINLDQARVRTLLDDKTSWPAANGLIISGFTYESIHPLAPHTAQERLPWLELQTQKSATLQPYEQLAKVLTSQGARHDARDILVAKEWKHHASKQCLGKFGSWLLGCSIGFGYRPWRALLPILALILIGWGVFETADSQWHCMVPTKERVYMGDTYATQRVLPPEYPRLRPLIYSIDLLLPFVDLKQDDMWQPSNKIGKRGFLVSCYSWFHIALGWILSALFVAGISGLVKRD